jgi:hypothetical protein
MEIEYGGEPAKEIYFKAIRWVFKPSKKTMVIRIAVFVVFTALYLALIFAELQEGGVSTFESSRIIRHLFTVLLLAYIVFQPAITAQRKASALWSDPSSRRHRMGRVSPLGVRIDPMNDWMLWETFIRREIQPDYIVLLNASRMFVLLQRTFFKDAQDWKMVQSMTEQKVKEASD